MNIGTQENTTTISEEEIIESRAKKLRLQREKCFTPTKDYLDYTFAFNPNTLFNRKQECNHFFDVIMDKLLAYFPQYKQKISSYANYPDADNFKNDFDNLGHAEFYLALPQNEPELEKHFLNIIELVTPQLNQIMHLLDEDEEIHGNGNYFKQMAWQKASANYKNICFEEINSVTEAYLLKTTNNNQTKIKPKIF